MAPLPTPACARGATARLERREAFTLVEVVLALALGVALLHMGLLATRALATASERLERRAGDVHSRLLAEAVLREEIRRGEVSMWPDSIRLRAVRGFGIVCGGVAPEGAVVVAWRGARLPDSRKDSVEFVHGHGERTVARLLRSQATTEPCDLSSGFGTVRTIETEPTPPPDVVLLRVFEPGSYHLADGTLRYRSGRGGRQPLTDGGFAPGAAAFRAGDGTIVVDLRRERENGRYVRVHIDGGSGS